MTKMSDKTGISVERDQNRRLRSQTDSQSQTNNQRQPIESSIDKCFENSSNTNDNNNHNQHNNDLFIEQIKPILKRKSLDELEVKTLPSILKKRDSFDCHSSHVKHDSNYPTLKRHSLGSESDHRNPSVLFTTEIDIYSSPSSSSKSSNNVYPILKHKSLDEKCVQSRDEQSLPKPILKKKWSIEDQIERCCVITDTNHTDIDISNAVNAYNNNNNNKTRSILKTGFDSEKTIIMSKTPEMRGILKVGQKSDSKPVKSALKKCDQKNDNKLEFKSILKPETIGSDEKIDISDSGSSDEEIGSESSPKSDSETKTDAIEVDKECINNVNNSESDKLNDQKRSNLETNWNNSKRRENKRPTSCIIMSTTKPFEFDDKFTPISGKASGGSICDRLAALKQNGEENWKKRVAPEVELRVPTSNNSRNRCSSIADRLSLLEDSSLKWKNRVGEKDVNQFTVLGKMNQNESPVIITPEVQRKTPKAVPFRSEKTAQMLQSFVPSLSATHSSKSQIESIIPNAKKSDTNNSVSVTIPKADDDITFNSFFTTKAKPLSGNNEVISDNDFNAISTNRSELLVQKKSVRAQNRRPVSSNPIKKLKARTDFTISSYTETVASDQSQKDISISLTPKCSKDLVKRSSLAPSALAGLASREDIKAVAGKLRSSTTSRETWKSYDMPNSCQNMMLVQVKGRRRAQTRLVEPNIKSINSGDCYILVTKDDAFAWIGKYCNIIERTKTLEITNQIQKKKDLCFRSSNNFILIDHQKDNFMDQSSDKRFFKELNGNTDESINPPKNPEEDECYEEAIIGTNMIYRVNNEELVPLENYWGRIPRFEMLTDEDAYVFDFGSEMYVWVGKLATNIKRKCALDSAKDLWNKGYDYSECDINPFGPNVQIKSDKRPHWTWFTKISQNMESVLFKDKFLNWPSVSRVVKSNSFEKERDICSDFNLVQIDAKLLISDKLPEPDMILENTHLGRGVRWDDESERTHSIITTLNVKCWHISEYEKHELSNENLGYFYSGDSYVIRWNYRLSRVGRDLKTGNVSRHSMMGRDRCCYFFWHGRDASNTEKGASALMTVELDDEKAQQVRVPQGKEEPCFLNIFKGSLVILVGKRSQKTFSDSWKMFLLKGVLSNEACLVEVECKVHSLRSRTCFAFVNSSNQTIYVWNGSKSMKETRDVMKKAVEMLIKNKSSEMGLSSELSYDVNEFEEGNETKEFWHLFGLSQRKHCPQLYYSLIDSKFKYSYTPRLFHFTSTSGQFESKEMGCSYRSINNVVPYPFTQEDIYSAQQPTFFLLDNQNEIYLWESKFPFSQDIYEETEENKSTGSLNIRWTAERRCALDTTLAYCHAKDSDEPPNAYVISAGLEPDCFCCLFPQWKYREDVAMLHIKDGRKPGEKLLIQEVLSQLRNRGSSYYKLEELRKKPTPEGLNPLCLESYLEDKEFEETLGMSREEFYTIPTWKQRSLKQKAELF